MSRNHLSPASSRTDAALEEMEQELEIRSGAKPEFVGVGPRPWSLSRPSQAQAGSRRRPHQGAEWGGQPAPGGGVAKKYTKAENMELLDLI